MARSDVLPRTPHSMPGTNYIACLHMGILPPSDAAPRVVQDARGCGHYATDLMRLSWMMVFQAAHSLGKCWGENASWKSAGRERDTAQETGDALLRVVLLPDSAWPGDRRRAGGQQQRDTHLAAES